MIIFNLGFVLNLQTCEVESTLTAGRSGSKVAPLLVTKRTTRARSASFYEPDHTGEPKTVASAVGADPFRDSGFDGEVEIARSRTIRPIGASRFAASALDSLPERPAVQGLDSLLARNTDLVTENLNLTRELEELRSRKYGLDDSLRSNNLALARELNSLRQEVATLKAKLATEAAQIEASGCELAELRALAATVASRPKPVLCDASTNTDPVRLAPVQSAVIVVRPAAGSGTSLAHLVRKSAARVGLPELGK